MMKDASLIQAIIRSCLCFWVGVSAMAQSPSQPAPVDEKKPVQQKSEAAKLAPAKPAASALGFKPLKIGDVIISGSLRTRVENWNFFDSPAADGEYTFSGTILRFSASQKKESYEWQIEAAVPVLGFLPSKSAAPAPGGQLGLGASYFAANGNHNEIASIFPKQAFIRFFGQDDKPSSARFGRFEFIEGLENAQKDTTLGFLKREHIGHRLVGNFGFTHVGRSFDGIEFKRETGRSNIDVMAGRATRGVFQTDGLGEMDVDIQYAAYTRQLAMGSKSPGEWRIFALGYHDGRGITKVDNRPKPALIADTKNIRIGTWGAHYIQTVQVGKAKADYLFWAALQYGSWGIQEHLASSFAVEAGIQPDWAGKPWLRAGFDYASGDGNPNDGRHGTFFQPLPTPRIYARFPFYNAMNLQDAFASLLLRPHPKLALRTEFHNLRLSDANDRWYAGGGAFAQKGNFGVAGRPSNGSNDLGNVVDLGADWNMNPHFTWSAYYAHAFGHSVIKSIFPKRADADFAYLELLYKF